MARGELSISNSSFDDFEDKYFCNFAFSVYNSTLILYSFITLFPNTFF